MRVFSVLLALLIMISGQVNADTDEGLYAPKAPEGSAFVRFVNVGNASLEVRTNRKKFDDVEALASSPYYVFPEGEVTFFLDAKEVKATIVSDGYYTVSATDRAFMIKDTVNDDRTKATLALYNFQDDGLLSLKAKGGTVTILEKISSKKSAARDINPVKIDLTVEQGNGEFIAVEPFIMERGNHYSAFYNGENAFVVTAIMDTTR